MDELEEHIFDRRCRAQACKDMIEYTITAPADPNLPKAADYCPTGAIVPAEGGYTIEQSLCVQCNVCREIAPDAVALGDRFPLGMGAAPELVSVQPAQR